MTNKKTNNDDDSILRGRDTRLQRRKTRKQLARKNKYANVLQGSQNTKTKYMLKKNKRLAVKKTKTGNNEDQSVLRRTNNKPQIRRNKKTERTERETLKQSERKTKHENTLQGNKHTKTDCKEEET